MSTSGADMTSLSSAGASPQLQGVFGGTPQTAGSNFMNGQAPQSVPFYGGGKNYDMPQQDYLSDGGSQMPNIAGLLGGAGGGKSSAVAPMMQGGAGHAGHGGAVNFMPQSAITAPYTLGTGQALGLLQQIASQYKLNPLG